MPSDEYVLALDEGTTSARALIFSRGAEVKGVGQSRIRQFYPQPGWVEEDPNEIWEAQLRAARKAIRVADVNPSEIASVGITNQRETTTLWDRLTGRPIYNSIVWQCRRTAEIVESLREHASLIKERTGLVPDSYFSGPKIRWLLDNISGLRERAEKGEILFGTVDTWLLYKLTGGKVHATDYSNASRTMLFDIRKLMWDPELLELLKIPVEILPEAVASSGVVGYTEPHLFRATIPLAGILGDQQAALFGQTAFEPGTAKCTYGTGNFMLMNTGSKPIKSKKLLTTVAWGLNNEISYALEGSVFVTGAAVQWLQEALHIAKTPLGIEKLASSLPSNEGVYFVPSFTGLGAPYWDQYSRGTILGLTRGSTQAHLARATLESIAYLTRDVSEAMEAEGQIKLRELRVDGGGTRNDWLMQFQSDILGKRVVRPRISEITALGVAFIAGLATGVWSDKKELGDIWRSDNIYEPKMPTAEREQLYLMWKAAVERSLGWVQFN